MADTMRIALAVPHTGTVKAEFAQSLTDMVAHTLGLPFTVAGRSVRPEFVTLFADQGSIDLKRTRLALAARAQRCDFTLFNDADHAFPRDALVALMRHELPIVGCNYVQRNGTGPTAQALDGSPLETTEAKAKAGEVEEVLGLGFGLVLIRTAILDRVPAPWFQTRVGPNGDLECGEDIHFCNQARAAGIPVHVDHGLSWIVRHGQDRFVSFADLAGGGR